MSRALFLILFIALSISGLASASSERPERGLVHLLSYLAADYGGAVENGKVLSQFEYDEQKEFAQSAVELSQKLNNKNIAADVTRLQSMILEKQNAQQVSALALAISKNVIQVTGLPLSPSQWPVAQRGAQIYAQNCVSCHGQEGKGDGPDGKGLEPAPANFWNQERMAELSPFGAYNTIALGVNGTGMASFAATLTEEQIWDVTFYVMAFRHRAVSARMAPPIERLAQVVTLEEVSTTGDRALAESLKSKLTLSDEEAQNAVVILRTEEPPQGPNGPAGGLGKARQLMQDSLKSKREGKDDQAQQEALDAYLQGVEPVEPQLSAVSSGLLLKIEMAMAHHRQALKKGEGYEVAHEQVLTVLSEAEAALGQKSSGGAWATFLLAGGIMLREGLEAVLIVVTILAVAGASGVGRAGILWIHAGWAFAVFLGVLSWFFTGMLLEGLERELMEGIAALLAVAVLLYMGVWLHGKSEISKWTSYVKEKAQLAMSTGRLVGLASISFVATFREAFESVIFLRALWIDGQSEGNRAIFLGVVFSLSLALVAGALILRYGKRLPLGKLFSTSAGLMLALAVILAGKGVHALQEIDYIGRSAIDGAPSFELLGFYPTWQTLLVQVVVAVLAVALWVISGRPARPTTQQGLA